MFNRFGWFRRGSLRSEELERFKQLTAIPGVIDALERYNLGVTSVAPYIGPQVQECVHLSNTLTSRAGIASDVLFGVARTGQWQAVERRLLAFQSALEDAGDRADSELEAIIQWAERNSLPELKPHNAGFYKTTGIPRDKKKLMSLSFIHLPNSGIRDIPAELAVLPIVQGIFLNDNEISELPESICQMQTVLMLHLENNRIERLPESIGNMASLTLIDLDENNVSYFPRSLLNLRNLRKVRLRHQKHGNSVPLDEASRSVLTRLSMNPDFDLSI